MPRRWAASSASMCPSACSSGPIRRRRPKGSTNVRCELGDAQAHRFDPVGRRGDQPLRDEVLPDPAAASPTSPTPSTRGAPGAARPAATRPNERARRSTPRSATRRSHRSRARTRSRRRCRSHRGHPRGRRLRRDGSRTSRSRSSTDATSAPRPPTSRGFQDTSVALASLSEGEAVGAVERLRQTLAAHHSDERGVVLDSRSWSITARRRRQDVETCARPEPAHSVDT